MGRKLSKEEREQEKKGKINIRRVNRKEMVKKWVVHDD